MKTPLASRLARWVGAIRYVALLGVVSTMVGAFLMFLTGAKKTWTGLVAFSSGTRIGGGDPALDASAMLTTQLFSALDAFLFGIVMLYVACGIFTLFVVDDPEEVSKQLPRHLVPKSFAQLKYHVAMVVVVLLFVLFLELAWSSLAGLHGKTWELLVIPGAVFLLSVSLWFLAPDKQE